MNNKLYPGSIFTYDGGDLVGKALWKPRLCDLANMKRLWSARLKQLTMPDDKGERQAMPWKAPHPRGRRYFGELSSIN